MQVYHVVSVLSGVGEEVFLVFYSCLLHFFTLSLLLLPHLPDSFRSFSTLLRPCRKHDVMSKFDYFPIIVFNFTFLSFYLSNGLIFNDVKVLQAMKRISLNRSQLQQR